MRAGRSDPLGVGTLTTFRLYVGELEGVLEDVLDALRASPHGDGAQTALLACIGQADLMVLSIDTALGVLDALPASAHAAGRAFTSFLWHPGPVVREIVGAPEDADWLGGLDEFFEERPGADGARAVHAVVYARLAPEVVLDFPPDIPRRARILQAIQVACGPQSTLQRLQAPDPGAFRVCPLVGSDEVEALFLVQARDLDVLAHVAGALRGSSWSPELQCDQREQNALLAYCEPDLAGAALGALPLFDSVTTYPSLRLVRDGRPDRAEDEPPWLVVAPPEHRAGEPRPVARRARVETSVSYPPAAEDWVREHFQRPAQDGETLPIFDGYHPFGPYQLQVPRCREEPLTRAMLEGVVRDGLGLEPGGRGRRPTAHQRGRHMGWGVHAETTISVPAPDPDPTVHFAPSGLVRSLVRLRHRHAPGPGLPDGRGGAATPPGLAPAWRRACRAAGLSPAVEQRGSRLIDGLLRRLVADPELFGVPIPILLAMVKAAQSLGERLPEERRARPTPAERTAQGDLMAYLASLEAFSAAHPASIGSRTSLSDRSAVLAGKAGWRLTTDAVGAMAQGWWARLRRGNRTVLVLPHDGPTLRVEALGSQGLVVRVPTTAARLSPLDWHLPAGLAGGCFAATTYEDVNQPGRSDQAVLRQRWSELAACCDLLAPHGDDTLGDLVAAAAAQLRSWSTQRGHATRNLWTEAVAALRWRLPAIQLGLALVERSATECLRDEHALSPWFLLGPHMVRVITAALEAGAPQEETLATALVGVIAADLPDDERTRSARIREVLDHLARHVEVLVDLQPARIQPLDSGPRPAGAAPPAALEAVLARVGALWEDLRLDVGTLQLVARKLIAGMDRLGAAGARDPHELAARARTAAITEGILAVSDTARRTLLLPLAATPVLRRDQEARHLFLDYARRCGTRPAGAPACLRPWLPFISLEPDGQTVSASTRGALTRWELVPDDPPDPTGDAAAATPPALRHRVAFDRRGALVGVQLRSGETGPSPVDPWPLARETREVVFDLAGIGLGPVGPSLQRLLWRGGH